MKETQFLGTLLPSHPDFQPVIQQIREKYQLREILPDTEPIRKVYLQDKEVSLEEFRQEIKSLVEKIPDLLPPEISKILSAAREVLAKPPDTLELRLVPKKLKRALIDFMKVSFGTAESTIKLLDQFYSDITDMLYIYLLTGETQEIGRDWISKVVTGSAFGEPIVVAIATQIANPDLVVQQFREEMKKTFGPHRPKVTNISVSTAYFMQLQRAPKPWNFIVEEFIRLNHFSLPRDRSSKRYFETYRRYEQLLRKRIDRSKTVLEILLKDKK